MADIKVWQNDAQQLFEMNQDLASVNAAGVESDGQLAFFVGKPTTGNQWTLKKITPNELGKLVYDYLTSANIASQLASVLGGLKTAESFPYASIDDIDVTSAYCFTGNAYGGPYPYALIVTICLVPAAYYSRLQIIVHAPPHRFGIRTRSRTGGWSAFYEYNSAT